MMYSIIQVPDDIVTENIGTFLRIDIESTGIMLILWFNQITETSQRSDQTSYK